MIPTNRPLKDRGQSVLHTSRLILRRFTRDDAEAYWPLVSDPDVLRYTGEQPLDSLHEVRELLESRSLRDYAVHGFGRMACIEKASGRLIGMSGLKYLEDLKEVDIGYRFLPSCWGRGYATESARAAMHHGVCEVGIGRIIGLVEPENLASANVLEKLGLVRESDIRLHDHPGMLRLYSSARTPTDDRREP